MYFLWISFQEAFQYPKPGNAIAHCRELGISQETRFDTLTPINLIFLFLCRKGAISRLALFLRMSRSLVGNNKDLDILLNLIRLKEEQFNNNPISLGKG